MSIKNFAMLILAFAAAIFVVILFFRVLSILLSILFSIGMIVLLAVIVLALIKKASGR